MDRYPLKVLYSCNLFCQFFYIIKIKKKLLGIVFTINNLFDIPTRSEM